MGSGGIQLLCQKDNQAERKVSCAEELRSNQPEISGTVKESS